MAELVQIDGIWLRKQDPQGEGPHPLIVMLHGLTGDEDVMWIFAPRLPQNAILIAPRGIFPAASGGYGWQKQTEGVDGGGGAGFTPAVAALERLLRNENFPEANVNAIGLVGFSQGAALAYTYAMLHPTRITALAGLAGFMPASGQSLAESRPLPGRTVFLAHGTQDEIVPYERAIQAKTIFEQAGAQVILCSDDVGHKLSSNCFKGLEKYYRDQFGV